MAVDEAPDHNMSVWDWSRGERGYKLLETKVRGGEEVRVEEGVGTLTSTTCPCIESSGGEGGFVRYIWRDKDR